MTVKHLKKSQGRLVMRIIQIVAAVVLTLFAAMAVAEQAPDSVKQLADSLKKWGENPVLVAAAKSQNAGQQTLEQIKQRDSTWRDTSGVDDFMQAMMDNEAAAELRRLENSEGYYFELFLMDDQGANVAMTNKTSDYWQGDEAKFTEAFNDGKGGVHISEVEFDESAQAYLVQVSVPVMDVGRAIGALTIGINIDELEGQ
jgi:hypothetical protein